MRKVSFQKQPIVLLSAFHAAVLCRILIQLSEFILINIAFRKKNVPCISLDKSTYSTGGNDGLKSVHDGRNLPANVR